MHTNFAGCGIRGGPTGTIKRVATVSGSLAFITEVCGLLNPNSIKNLNFFVISVALDG